ncbi:MAG: RNA polymerase sigma factor [Clostridiaceae bacterium]
MEIIMQLEDKINETEFDVALAKKGNNEAFARLIHRYKHSMYRIAKSIVNMQEDAEDIVSESIIKAYTKIHTLKRNDIFKSWIFKIVINESYQFIRKNSKVIALDDVNLSNQIYEDTYIDGELSNAINKLEENQRIVTILFYYEDMSLNDISKLIDVPVGTVKSRLSRAKDRLRLLIND